MESALLASLLLLAAGILLRSAGALWALFLGTVVLGAAIVAANVLLPGLVKREFPGHAGLMTSVSSTAMGVSAALAAGASVPIARLTGMSWRGTLALWAPRLLDRRRMASPASP
jgi:MFS transporter, CP family, cyanate transporter